MSDYNIISAVPTKKGQLYDSYETNTQRICQYKNNVQNDFSH